MTKLTNAYTVTLADSDAQSPIMQLIDMEESIRDMGTVFMADIEVSREAVPASGKGLTLTLQCNDVFAAEVKNTKGIANVVKKASAPAQACAL